VASLEALDHLSQAALTTAHDGQLAFEPARETNTGTDVFDLAHEQSRVGLAKFRRGAQVAFDVALKSSMRSQTVLS
jgi:hypothetical protein